VSQGAFRNRLTRSPVGYLVLNRALVWRGADEARVPLRRRVVAFLGKLMRRRIRARHRRGALVRRGLHLARAGE
jgi:hypothetical protein